MASNWNLLMLFAVIMVCLYLVRSAPIVKDELYQTYGAPHNADYMCPKTILTEHVGITLSQCGVECSGAGSCQSFNVFNVDDVAETLDCALLADTCTTGELTNTVGYQFYKI